MDAWRPIETLGFGVDQHIIIATECGFAWVVECDKDMDGEWLKRSYGKDAEHTGPVTHWRLLDLPSPGETPNVVMTDARAIARVAVATFIGAISPDALNREGVPWTLEVAQALDALQRIALGNFPATVTHSEEG